MTPGSARIFATRRGSDIHQIRQSELRDQSADALGIHTASTKARRRARWSRDPTAQRIARVQEWELQLTASNALDADDDDDDDGGSSSPWRSRAESVAEDEPRDTSGFLLKKSGAFSGTKRRFFVLAGGTLLWYKSESDRSPAGYLHLAEAFAISEASAARPLSAARMAAGRMAAGRAERVGSGSVRSSDSSADADAMFVIKAHKEYTLWAEDESEVRATPPVRACAPREHARLASARRGSPSRPPTLAPTHPRANPPSRAIPPLSRAEPVPAA